MIYIGLDNGSKKFGFAMLDSEKKTWYGTTIVRSKGKADKFDKELHSYDIWNQIAAKLPEDPEQVVIGIEKYFIKRSRGKDVLPWLQGFMAASVYGHYDKKLQVEYVGSQEWKKELIGFKTSGKEFVEEYVRRHARAEKLQVTIGTQISDKEDTYDAMGISYFLWKKYSKK